MSVKKCIVGLKVTGTAMNIRKFAQIAGLVSGRDARFKATQKSGKKLYLDFMTNELEKRQLLATFGYNSGSGLLTIQTDSSNEQLTILSSSESGNYTLSHNQHGDAHGQRNFRCHGNWLCGCSHDIKCQYIGHRHG